MRRAIRDDQKAERRRAILDATWAAFAQLHYDQVHLAQIAQEVGIAKGTLFLYFTSKEELFLALYQEQLGAWLDAVEAALRSTTMAMSPAALGDLFAQSLAVRPHLARLFAITHTILEQSLAPAIIYEFKLGIQARLEPVGALLAARLLLADPHEGTRLLLRGYALVIGFYSLAVPTPSVAAVLASDERLTLFRLDFISELSTAFTAILRAARRQA